MTDKDSPDKVHPLSQRLGRRIAEIRQSMSMTQEVLAEKSGTSQPYLVRIERGDVNISTKMLGEIAEALGVDAAILFEFRHNVPQSVLKEELNKRIDTATPEQLRNIYRIVEILVY